MTFPGGEQVLINTLGHGAGVLIFAIFLYLVVRQRSASHLRVSWLSLVAALLALLWNLASLVVLAIGSDDASSERIVATFGFSFLSLLPAVLLNLCLIGRFPFLVRAGYALSALAIAAHVLELVRNATTYHRIGLSIISLGFGLLTALAVIRVLWSQEQDSRPLTSRILAAMSCFLFATSFVHFGDGHLYQAWSAELAIHHAGIPLALFVLLQEFRFVLLDAFVRFLATGLLAGLFGIVIAKTVPGTSFPLQALTAGALVAAFAISREYVQRFLSRIIFRQPDPDRMENALGELRSKSPDEAAYLQNASQCIAGLMKAPVVDAPSTTVSPTDLYWPTRVIDLPNYRELQRMGIRVVVPIRLSHDDTRFAFLGERRGGQPFLSEDLELLARMSSRLASEVERIRETEFQRLAAEAELRALQSQIHPHFLFNALNALYGVIPREAAGARKMLLNLADIFRYFLQANKTFVPLDEEIHIVEAYLSIERMRLGERLKTEILVDAGVRREPIPILSIQPLVENAVKHGAASKPEGGRVSLQVTRQQCGLLVCVSDTGPGFAHTAQNGSREGSGLALDNVRRRLRLCYGPEAALSIESSAEGSRVSFVVPAKLSPVRI